MAGRTSKRKRASQQEALNFTVPAPCPAGLPSTRIQLNLAQVRGCPIRADIGEYFMSDGMRCLDCPLGNPAAADRAVEEFLRRMKHEDKEFGFSPVFDPYLVDACCVRGVFPMSMAPLPDVEGFPSLGDFRCFAPKLHVSRSILDLAEFKPQKSAVKKASGYTVTVQTHLDDVMKAVVRHHSDNWLCKPLQAVFRHIHAHPDHFRARFVTLCIWKPVGSGAPGERELVASEIGCCTGRIYTSMTGTCEESGAGSVQLAVLGAVLKLAGFTCWDFGMPMRYKQDLGGKLRGRREWLDLVAEHGAPPTLPLRLPDGAAEMGGRDVFARFSAAAAPPADVDAAARKALKLKKKEEKRQKGAAWREHGGDPPPAS